MIHELKILPEYFADVISGRKTFEVRKFDRPFHEGDLLALNEFDPKNKCYTGNSCLVYIDYILNDDEYCKKGYVVMSIKPCWVRKATAPISQMWSVQHCGFELRKEALNLINRQKANAEGLTNAVKFLNEQLSSAKAEAVKEVIETMKPWYEFLCVDKGDWYEQLDIHAYNLVKEMAGAESG